MIARYFDERDLHLTLAMSYKLEEIIDRFPSEKKVHISLCDCKAFQIVYDKNNSDFTWRNNIIKMVYCSS